MDKLDEQNNQINLNPFDDEALKHEMERRGWLVLRAGNMPFWCRHNVHSWGRWSPPDIVDFIFFRRARQTRFCLRCGKMEQAYVD